jgi:hypothetical protein
MTDARKTVLLGDGNHERASLLKKIIEDDFRTVVVWVKTFDAVKAQLLEVKNLNSRWKLVLMANDLPFTLFPSGNIQPESFSFVSQMEAVISLGCIYSTDGPPDMRGVSFDPIYIRVPPPPITDATRKIIIDNICNERRTRLVLAPDPPRIELDIDPVLLKEDPILREQLLSLSDERDLEKAKDVLAYLIRDFNFFDCDAVIVSKLVQGASGATVFRFRPKHDDLGVVERVLKISTHDKEWKLTAEVQRHLQAKDTLGNRYKRHVPDIEALRPADHSEPRYIASHEGWRAICYDFLGGKDFSDGDEEFGKFIDLETALIASSQDLKKRTWKTDFEEFFVDPATTLSGRKHVLHVLLDWLCKSWYLKYGDRGSAEPLWNYCDGPDSQFDRFPPYQLPGRSKRYILSFVDGRKGAIGARFFPDWAERVSIVRQFVTASEIDLSKQYSLHKKRTVICSPAHGDLNSNNILLWLNEKHPFLIDFPFFQLSGHALQDFARLEVEISLSLMDRQEGGPINQLQALDYTHSQMPLWTALEDQLLQKNGRTTTLSLPGGLFEDNVRLSYNLIMAIREKAKEVHARKKTSRAMGFWSEYRFPLLYHTLRAIGYDSLSPFKRILAVYSAAELLRQCVVK